MILRVSVSTSSLVAGATPSRPYGDSWPGGGSTETGPIAADMPQRPTICRLSIVMAHAVEVGRPPSMLLSGVWWPLRHGLGLFLGDLPQARLPVRLVLVQGPGECR